MLLDLVDLFTHVCTLSVCELDLFD